MIKIQRGTRDFNSEEMYKRNHIEFIMRKTFEMYGYREIQTPTFESLKLFTVKSGEGIIQELYSFKDKGGRDLALRPELTAPVIRFYVESLQMEPKPLKLFYFGNCYRYDRPQKGRYREFKQAGCEIIGADTPEAYAELIALAYKILQSSGLKNIKLKIGNLNILSKIFEMINLTKDQQKHITPLIDKSMFEDLLSALKDFKIKKEDVDKLIELLQTNDITKIKNFLNDEKSKKELNKFEKILHFIKNLFEIDFQINMSIVRGLDYYKGLVFEIEAPVLGAEKQLCGGGAYELISLFGGTETPSAGFAIGFDRTFIALESENYTFPNMEIDVYIIPLGEELIEKSLQIAQDLRSRQVKVDIDLMRRGIGKSLKYASSINAKKAIIIGKKEIEKDSVTLRDMKSGEQNLIKILKINEIFK